MGMEKLHSVMGMEDMHLVILVMGMTIRGSNLNCYVVFENYHVFFSINMSCSIKTWSHWVVYLVSLMFFTMYKCIVNYIFLAICKACFSLSYKACYVSSVVLIWMDYFIKQKCENELSKQVLPMMVFLCGFILSGSDLWILCHEMPYYHGVSYSKSEVVMFILDFTLKYLTMRFYKIGHLNGFFCKNLCYESKSYYYLNRTNFDYLYTQTKLLCIIHYLISKISSVKISSVKISSVKISSAKIYCILTKIILKYLYYVNFYMPKIVFENIKTNYTINHGNYVKSYVLSPRNLFAKFHASMIDFYSNCSISSITVLITICNCVFLICSKICLSKICLSNIYLLKIYLSIIHLLKMYHAKIVKISYINNSAIYIFYAAGLCLYSFKENLHANTLKHIHYSLLKIIQLKHFNFLSWLIKI